MQICLRLKGSVLLLSEGQRHLGKNRRKVSIFWYVLQLAVELVLGGQSCLEVQADRSFTAALYLCESQNMFPYQLSIWLSSFPSITSSSFHIQSKRGRLALSYSLAVTFTCGLIVW